MSPRATEVRRLAALRGSLPAAPWPARWVVQAAGGGRYAIAITGAPPREVLAERDISGHPGAPALRGVDELAQVVMVAYVTVRPGHGGLSEACRTAFLASLAFLVMEG